jgi:hypothetical protein
MDEVWETFRKEVNALQNILTNSNSYNLISNLSIVYLWKNPIIIMFVIF